MQEPNKRLKGAFGKGFDYDGSDYDKPDYTVENPFEAKPLRTLTWGVRSRVPSKRLLTPEELQAQREKDIRLKKAVAKSKGLASVENSEEVLEIEKESENLERSTEMETQQAIEADAQDERHKAFMTHGQAMLARAREIMEEINEKLDKEIAIERDRGKKIRSLENAWVNTRNSAVSFFGDKADFQAIDRSFQSELNKANPRVHDVTDIVSMEIDRALHGRQYDKVLMGDGSIRSMDPELAEFIALGRPGMIVKTRSNETSLDDSSPGASLYRELYDISVSSKEEQEQLDMIRQSVTDKIDEFSQLTRDNQKQAFAFESELYKTSSFSKSAESRQRSRKLPSVAYDYPYLVREDIYEYNGRKLPEAMSSPVMQRDLARSEPEYQL